MNIVQKNYLVLPTLRSHMPLFLSNQSQRLWTQTHPSGWGTEIGKNWADSTLSVFCLSDSGLWLYPSAEIKLFFLPCWATATCFFDQCLGTVFLTIVTFPRTPLQFIIHTALREPFKYLNNFTLGIKNIALQQTERLCMYIPWLHLNSILPSLYSSHSY
jgi:hypothetical protein